MVACWLAGTAARFARARLAEPADLGEQPGLLVDPGPGHPGGVGDAADGDRLAAAGQAVEGGRGQDLGRLLRDRFGDHSLVDEFREYLINAASTPPAPRLG
jgi:hypothetical protein